ncbi:MAG TPA: DUF6748 domain-containing protein [Kofleriaceae bacterium]
MTSILVPACATEPTDELGEETAADGEEGKGDAAGAFTFFNVIADTRACSLNSPPDCGSGFFVSRANRTTTQCGRGPAQSQCKLDLFYWQTGMPASVSKGYEDRLREGQSLLVRGSIQPDPADRGATLVVNEIWVPNTTEFVDGVFTLVKDNGVRCITAPCPSLTERRLNSNLFADITGIDFDASSADAEAIELAQSQLYGDGLIVVGYRDYDSRGGKVRTANRFFTKAPVPLF